MPGGRKGPKSEAERQRDRIRYLENARGIKHTIAPDAAMRRIKIWRQKGILLDTIAERTTVSKAQIRNIEGGVRTWIRTSTHAKIMGARFTPEDIHKFPGYGVRRRLRALAAIGYATGTLGEILGRDAQYVHAIMSGKNAREFVLRPLGLAVHQAYEKYQDVDPMDLGQSSFATNYAKSIARKRSWGAPKDWDEDTLDDPDAWPEFTGACGRVQGIMIHLRDSIPMCERCSHTLEHGGRSVDPLRIFELHSEGKTSAEIADELGVRKDLISHYVAPLNVVKVHTLSTANPVSMTGTCELCGSVKLRSAGVRNGASKLICYNSVEKSNGWAKKKEERDADV
jgi:hypothetical protein